MEGNKKYVNCFKPWTETSGAICTFYSLLHVSTLQKSSKKIDEKYVFDLFTHWSNELLKD